LEIQNTVWTDYSKKLLKKLFKRKTQILYKTSLYFIYMHIYYAYIVEYVGMYIDVHMCILVHVLSSFHLIEHNPTVGYLSHNLPLQQKTILFYTVCRL